MFQHILLQGCVTWHYLKNADDIEAYFEKNKPDLHSLYPCLPMHEHNWALSLVPMKQLQAWKK